jgi:hypothetical protein
MPAKVAKRSSAKSTPANGAGSAKDVAVLTKNIQDARDAGMKWSEIKDKFGIDPSQGQLLLIQADVKPKDKISFKSDADLKRQALALYKQGVSKAVIAARAGVSLVKLRGVMGDVARPVKAKAEKPKAKAAPAKSKAVKASDGPQAAPVRRRRKRAEVVQDPSAA